MYQYRCFIKDCLDLTGLPIANSICVSFDIEKDLLSTSTSNFVLLETPTNIKEGDILGLVDPYGTIIYLGVINSIGDSISCRGITAIFNDNWKYHDVAQTTIEGKLKAIIESDFINSSDPMIADRFPFTVVAQSSTSGTIETKDSTFVMDFETFVNNMYNYYGVITDIYVPFGEGTPTITLRKSTHSAIKIGNNVLPVQNMTPLTEVFETNKLEIYDKEGTTLRGTYYTTEQGITTNKNDPLRLPVTKTKFVFNSDDSLEDIKQENLQEEIYNHRITFDLLLNNGLYDFYDWELGMPIEVWYNGDYYSTIFTKYSMTKEMNIDVTSVSITCGKVRNTLTEKINSYQSPTSTYVGSGGNIVTLTGALSGYPNDGYSAVQSYPTGWTLDTTRVISFMVQVETGVWRDGDGVNKEAVIGGTHCFVELTSEGIRTYNGISSITGRAFKITIEKIA